MSPRRRRSSRQSSAYANYAGAALIGAVALAIIALVIWSNVTKSAGPHIEKASLCDVKGPSAVTAILVDATDTLPAVQRLAVVDRITRMVAGLHVNERVEIYEIRPDQDLLKPDFAKCRPAAPSEVSELTGNKRLAKQRFEDEFQASLKRVLDDSLDHPPSPRSPIMESIQAASVKSFSAPDLQSSAPGFRRQLIVISDMMQNSDAGSHYRGVPDFRAYKAQPQFSKLSSDMKNVSVTILYLRKDDATRVQGRSHVEFWENWFSAQGASVDDVVAM